MSSAMSLISIGAVDHARKIAQQNVEVLNHDGSSIEMRELDDEVFRATEELGIDLSRPERGSDEVVQVATR